MSNAHATSNGAHPSNPVALITGGSRGIGRSTALALAARGSDVIVTYVQGEESAMDLVRAIEQRGRRAAALRLDVADTASLGAFVEAVRGVLAGWGRERLDHLVNNAGTSAWAPIGEITEADLRAVLAVHVGGTLFVTQALLPLLADGGRIVNLSSGLARYAYPGLAAYSAAKAAVEALTRSMAVELGPRRISVNAVAPGGIVTDFGGGIMRDPGLQAELVATTPLGRVGEAEDVSGVIAMLLARETGWVTGQRLEATGGYRL